MNKFTSTFIVWLYCSRKKKNTFLPAILKFMYPSLSKKLC